MTRFGRRLGDRKAYGGNDPCAVTFVRLQLLGKVLMAENLRDILWSVEFLARHEQVDASRLGCVGLSYGGRMTMLAAALEPRIKFAVISGALNCLQERIQGRYSCGLGDPRPVGIRRCAGNRLANRAAPHFVGSRQ